MMLAAVLHRELPPELLGALKAANIPLLPHTWSAITTSCNCPDDADMCKHLASVFFILGTALNVVAL